MRCVCLLEARGHTSDCAVHTGSFLARDQSRERPFLLAHDCPASPIRQTNTAHTHAPSPPPKARLAISTPPFISAFGTTPEISSHRLVSMLAIGLRRPRPEIHTTEIATSAPKRRKLGAEKLSAQKSEFSAPSGGDCPAPQAAQPEQLHQKSDTDTEMEGETLRNAQEHTDIMQPTRNDEQACSCGYLHGPEGSHHDVTAIGLGVPLLRGPD